MIKPENVSNKSASPAGPPAEAGVPPEAAPPPPAPYDAAAGLVRALSGMQKSGKGDTAEASAARAELQAVWDTLGEADKDRLRKILDPNG